MAKTGEEQSRSGRRVKNPETFRERAIKATENDAKPGKRLRVGRILGSVFGPIFRPIAKVSKAIGSKPPFSWLLKLLRLIGLIVFPPYFRNSWKELRKVTWPTWKQSRQLTFAVLVFAIVFGGAVALVDYGLDKVFRQILLK